jgi:hypothetical protein
MCVEESLASIFVLSLVVHKTILMMIKILIGDRMVADIVALVIVRG